jgi:alpha-tubulin suppressor-like RCC1 family protein
MQRKKRKLDDDQQVSDSTRAITPIKYTNCCGGGNNRFQQLAQHKISSIPVPTPTVLHENTNVKHVSCGEDFVYFLTTCDQVWCAGINHEGQLVDNANFY